jgi:DNA repair exonuclease SbcCD ATPase subunit
MSYVEKFRSKKQYEETKGIDSKDVSNPDSMLKDKIEKIKQKIDEMDARQEGLQTAMEEERIKRQRVNEMEHQQEQLMIKTKTIQDSVEHNMRSIDQKKLQNEHIGKEIEKIRDEMKDVQTSINQQMLTSYEKEIAEQEIKALHDKKLMLEKTNSSLSKDINDGNREIHITCVQNINDHLSNIANALEIEDQKENYEEIVKSLDLDSIKLIGKEFSDSIKLKLHEYNIDKESLRNEELKAHNQNLKLQSEYSTVKVAYDNATKKLNQSEMLYDKLQQELDDRVKIDGIEMQLKK